MGVIGDIAALLGEAYRVWQDQQGQRSLSPRDLYGKYIAPSYSLLREVHTDYLELYLELEARVAASDAPTEILQWFARARIRRQIDRSELSLLQFPQITVGTRGRDVDAATQEYLNNVRLYFLPGPPPKLSKSRMYERLPSSRSTLTEDLLNLVVLWLRLSAQDQRALLAEEYYDAHFLSTDRFGHSELIQRILESSIDGYSEPKPEANVWGLADLIPEREIGPTPNGYKQVSWHQVAKDFFARQHWWQEMLEGRVECRQIPIAGATLAQVIADHARQQRESLELAMRKVQVAYMRLRVMAEH